MPPANVTRRVSRAVRKQARPKEIIRAALDVFGRHGFAGARIEDVAAKVGISKGTIYLYFNTKAELFKACVRETVGSDIAGTRALAEEFEGTASDLLREIVLGIGSHLAKGNTYPILSLMIGEGQRFPELVSFYHAEIIRPRLEILKAVIDRGVEDGEFRSNGLSDFPMLLMSPILISIIWNQLFSAAGKLNVDKVLQTHLDILLKGIEVKTDPAK